MDYAAARHNMVENQIRTNRVTDIRVTQALEGVPRERFVPKQLRGIAYIDEDLDLGNGRTVIEPLVLAKLLQAAEITPADMVLVIGCSSGYSAGVIARMAGSVVALECDGDLAAQASTTLSELGVDNVAVVTGPLKEGHAAQAPYDVIFFAGSVPEIPPALCNQLADGGRLVAVVNNTKTNVGHGTIVTRAGAAFGRRSPFDVSTRMLPGFTVDPGFVF